MHSIGYGMHRIEFLDVTVRGRHTAGVSEGLPPQPEFVYFFFIALNILAAL